MNWLIYASCLLMVGLLVWFAISLVGNTLFIFVVSMFFV